jgi:hypothetical protein
MIVVNRVINPKNHLVENVPIRPFQNLHFRILAIVINVLQKIKMKTHILLYVKKMIHLENIKLVAINVTNQ